MAIFLLACKESDKNGEEKFALMLLLQFYVGQRVSPVVPIEWKFNGE